MLGGEIIKRLNQADEDNRKLSPRELILHYVDEEGGPLLSFLDPNVKAELAQHMAVSYTHLDVYKRQTSQRLCDWHR